MLLATRILSTQSSHVQLCSLRTDCLQGTSFMASQQLLAESLYSICQFCELLGLHIVIRIPFSSSAFCLLFLFHVPARLHLCGICRFAACVGDDIISGGFSGTCLCSHLKYLCCNSWTIDNIRRGSCTSGTNQVVFANVRCCFVGRGDGPDVFWSLVLL